MKIRGYVAHSAKQPLEAFEYEPKAMQAHDVDVRITHCGICHSDIHLIDDDSMNQPKSPKNTAKIIIVKG